jgi:hypothetical protein
MSSLTASSARRTTPVTTLPNRPDSAVTLLDGTGLNVEMPSYLSQHDVVYCSPALDGGQGMPIGNGDLGAMLWCPDGLRLQVQKSDLWADAAANAPADAWQQLSAGAITLSSEPSFLRDPLHYEQRLSLHTGVITIDSETSQGACQISAFVSPLAGVLVVRYRDQTVRGASRRVDVTLDRQAHLFALGETIGVLQAFRDRRYAVLAQVVGCRARATNEGAGRCSLVMEPSRSSDFTLYVAVGVSSGAGDPVALARSRIQAAVDKGFERLLAEQRRHWSAFWSKSFLRLQGPVDDPLPAYLENLWYLALYQQACCSGGLDAPLANGALFLGDEACRQGAALYSGRDLRSMLANLLTSNHVDLAASYVDTYFRMLSHLAARTGSELGLGGAQFPPIFNRFGDAPPPTAGQSEGRVLGFRRPANARLRTPRSAGAYPQPPPVSGGGNSGSRSAVGAEPPTVAPASGRPAGTRQPKREGNSSPFPVSRVPASAGVNELGKGAGGSGNRQSVTEGLETGLLVWEAWRHAPDRFFLQERVYPLLRAATVFGIERCQTVPGLWHDPGIRSQVATALRALIWAESELAVQDDARPEWAALAATLKAEPAHRPDELLPFGRLRPLDTAEVFRSLLRSVPQQPCGVFGLDPKSPDLAFSAQLCTGISSLLLTEHPVAPADSGIGRDGPRSSHAPGPAIPGAIQVFGGLPDSWSGAFTLAAPGGFRVSAEAADGEVRYVAIKSLLGGPCRVVNPWGASIRVRIRRGAAVLTETSAGLIEFITGPNTTSLIERCTAPVSGGATVRLVGRPNITP